jgi:hypothetical protein
MNHLKRFVDTFAELRFIAQVQFVLFISFV